MIKKGVFISFCWDNRDLTKRVYSAIKKTRHLYPIVITNPERANAQLWNPEKVAFGIKECSFFISIMSELSLNSQWVNQEIGFAAALERPLYSIVEQNLVDAKKLKGWVNPERDQPYRYDLHKDSKIARRLFRNAYKPLLENLDEQASILVLSDLTDRDKVKLKNGTLVFHGSGNSKAAFLQLNDIIYPIADMPTFQTLKILVSNKNEKYVDKSDIDKLKRGQLIRQ